MSEHNALIEDIAAADDLSVDQKRQLERHLSKDTRIAAFIRLTLSSPDSSGDISLQRCCSLAVAVGLKNFDTASQRCEYTGEGSTWRREK